MLKFCALLLVSFGVLANPQQELVERINKTEGFSANFSQQVLSPDNEVLMEGEGKVEISKPSLFRWTLMAPDEEVMVSDGKALWYYSPFIEQVSIYDAQTAIEQTPFVLLTRNKNSDWDKYSITQQDNRFVLTPTAIDSNQGQFYIDITSNGVVEGFSVVEQDGQRSHFEFSQFASAVPNKDRFVFTTPDGVEVDDQRSNVE
ncbi:outer membrane lipoprotein chaperone LolA [Vibrio ulleungensis]|uniref:Outer-membrane lipoprotein carrier protein n=1 Tax=Vibrio ulleungensis TaxID=2807619 RepID=A0ABS2HGI0_9VIBR|nr:outer membrane lipoprotein chaperone LolA [Vibrio ulleungensis]MBM7036206.1 outer membrane lipoprotein chaperone LolA [Vibrio ulleungensis]